MLLKTLKCFSPNQVSPLVVQVRRFLLYCSIFPRHSSPQHSVSCVIVTLHRVFVVCLYLISNSSAFIPPCPHSSFIRDRNRCRFNDIDFSAWTRTIFLPVRYCRARSVLIPATKSRVRILRNYPPCPFPPLAFPPLHHGFLKKESPRRVKADEKCSRTC